jgi:sulfoxide reductase heme-binding subunit YedZ
MTVWTSRSSSEALQSPVRGVGVVQQSVDGNDTSPERLFKVARWIRPMSVSTQVNGWIKRVPAWPIYFAAPLPVAWLFYQAVIGQLGVDPAKAIEHQVGLWGLWLLIAGLAITPLARLTGVRLIKFRRAIGITTFFYILVHLLVWVILDVQILSLIWSDILKRPYIAVGMAAFVIMVPLVVTSNNLSIRKVGAARWKQLHRLTYVAAVLGAVHFVMLVKGWQIEPLLYLLGVLCLLALRFKLPKGRSLRSASAPTRV